MALPWRVHRNILARAYGQSPMAVEEWPADEYLFALKVEGYMPRGL